MAIYSGFSHKKLWFSIVMLVYQRVNTNPVAQWCIMVYHVPSFSHEKQQSWGCILHFRATFWALASTVHQGSASSSIKRRSGQISLLWLLNSVDCCYGAFGCFRHLFPCWDGSWWVTKPICFKWFAIYLEEFNVHHQLFWCLEKPGCQGRTDPPFFAQELGVGCARHWLVRRS